MMTRVNKMVAYQYESSSSNADYHQKKQIPSIATRLTAEMYFTPKQLQTKQLRVLRVRIISRCLYFESKSTEYNFQNSQEL